MLQFAKSAKHIRRCDDKNKLLEFKRKQRNPDIIIFRFILDLEFMIYLWVLSQSAISHRLKHFKGQVHMSS